MTMQKKALTLNEYIKVLQEFAAAHPKEASTLPVTYFEAEIGLVAYNKDTAPPRIREDTTYEGPGDTFWSYSRGTVIEM